MKPDLRDAAEALADAVEDLLYTEGDHLEAVRVAWQAYVEAAEKVDE